jgi:hypothetical protein
MTKHKIFKVFASLHERYDAKCRPKSVIPIFERRPCGEKRR